MVCMVSVRIKSLNVAILREQLPNVGAKLYVASCGVMPSCIYRICFGLYYILKPNVSMMKFSSYFVPKLIGHF
jgi:hypothetical protein